jgi:hypothetical protein
MIVTEKFERRRNEVVVAYFKALENEENHQTL